MKGVQEVLKGFDDLEVEVDIDKGDTSSTSSRCKTKKLVNGRGETGWNAFHWAVYFGNIHIIHELLKYGANVNLETQEGWTALQLAVYKNSFEGTL